MVLLWGWEERKELEKVMIDYIRWLCNLDFCTPRYVITRKLVMDKLKIKWGIRLIRYKKRILGYKEERLVNIWREKEKWDDRYGTEEEKYYNRNRR